MESRHDATPPRRQKQFEPPSELDALAERVLDAAFEVHRDVGPGFGERCYEAAMAIELGLRGVPFLRQPVITLRFKASRLTLGLLLNFNVRRLVMGMRRVILTHSDP